MNILFSEITEDKDVKENEIHSMLDQIQADHEVKIAEMTAKAVRTKADTAEKIAEMTAEAVRIKAEASVTFTPDTKQPSNEEEAKREVDVTPDTAQ